MNRAQIASPPTAIELSRDGHHFSAAATDTELDGLIQSIQRPLVIDPGVRGLTARQAD